MKKVIAGSVLAGSSLLAEALLLAGSMANDWTINGAHSALWNLQRYGLMPALYAFAGIGIIGFLLAVWGLIEKDA